MLVANFKLTIITFIITNSCLFCMQSVGHGGLSSCLNFNESVCFAHYVYRITTLVLNILVF